MGVGWGGGGASVLYFDAPEDGHPRGKKTLQSISVGSSVAPIQMKPSKAGEQRDSSEEDHRAERWSECVYVGVCKCVCVCVHVCVCACVCAVPRRQKRFRSVRRGAERPRAGVNGNRAVWSEESVVSGPHRLRTRADRGRADTHRDHRHPAGCCLGSCGLPSWAPL